MTNLRKLTAALMVGAMMIGEASAGLVCGRGQIDFGDTRRNGVVSSVVSVDDGVWTVMHTLANGTVIDRSLQYVMLDNSNDNKSQWIKFLKLNDQPVEPLAKFIERGEF